MNEQSLHLNERIVSIDALRGLAMFLILAYDIGGAPVLQTFIRLWGENFADAAANQLEYEFTTGLRFSFIAMPMFLFVVGLVIPFSLKSRKLQKNGKNIYLHIIKRALILFLLGLIAGGHLLNLRFSNMPVYNNVLEYISIGYLVCAILVLNTTPSVQAMITAGLLIIYWMVFMLIPVPGWQGEIYSGEMNLAIYIDDVVLGQFHHHGSWQVLATVNFISNMLLGVLTGQLIHSNRDKEAKTRLLFFCGLAMLIAGLVWSPFFPIIRSLWTSSFVLVTCGITTLVFAVFYLLIDVRGYSNWPFFFVVFGANSIAIYMMAHMFDFSLIGNIFVGGLSSLFPANIRDFIQAVAAMMVMWLIMYYMYIKKTFIKV